MSINQRGKSLFRAPRWTVIGNPSAAYPDSRRDFDSHAEAQAWIDGWQARDKEDSDD